MDGECEAERRDEYKNLARITRDCAAIMYATPRIQHAKQHHCPGSLLSSSTYIMAFYAGPCDCTVGIDRIGQNITIPAKFSTIIAGQPFKVTWDTVKDATSFSASLYIIPGT